MWHAAHVNQARGAKTQETSALAWLAVRAPRQPGTSLWPCLHGNGYFIRPAWPYLIMSLMEEGEALAKIQTSSVCISLRGITICKHAKSGSFVQTGKTWTENLSRNERRSGRSTWTSQVRRAALVQSCHLALSV